MDRTIDSACLRQWDNKHARSQGDLLFQRLRRAAFVREHDAEATVQLFDQNSSDPVYNTIGLLSAHQSIAGVAAVGNA